MNKTTKIIVGIVIIVIIIVLVIVLSAEKKEEGVIKIGAILPLTGAAADYGEEELQGMKLALDETSYINERKIVLLVEDSKNDPKEGISAFKKLADIEKIDFLAGSMSSVGLALKKEIKEKNIPTTWIGAHPDLITNNAWIFRNIATSKQYVETITEAIEIENIEKIGMFYINDDFGDSVKNIFIQSFKGIVTDIEMYNKDGKDFRTEITKLLATKPDSIFIAGYGSATGLLIKQLRERGYFGSIFGLAEISSTNTKKAAGEAINGVIFLDYNTSTAFEEKCLSSIGKKPTPDILVGYIGIKVILHAIEQTNGRKEKVRSYLSNLSDFQTVVGPISIKNNEIRYSLNLMEFVEGKSILYSK